jgi:hypothetical protein
LPENPTSVTTAKFEDTEGMTDSWTAVGAMSAHAAATVEMRAAEMAEMMGERICKSLARVGRDPGGCVMEGDLPLDQYAYYLGPTDEFPIRSA